MKQTVPALLVVIVGIVGAVVLDLYALSQGVNGTMYAATLAFIGALVGGFCGFTFRGK